MKRIAAFTIILATLTMSSCLITSLHPFYKAGDKIFNEKLVGRWLDTDSSVWVIKQNMISRSLFGEPQPDTSYYIKYFEDDNSVALLQGTLFKIKGQHYVDFEPHREEDHFTSDFTGFHHAPVHTLARLYFKKDTLVLSWYGEEWLNKLFEQNRIRIEHEVIRRSEDYARRVLTAETEDLQKFIRKYMSDGNSVEEIEAEAESGDIDDEFMFVKLFPYDGPVPE